MNIISIDPSLYSTGIYCSGSDNLYNIKPDKKNTYSKQLAYIISELKNIKETENPELLIIEDYAYNKNNSGKNKLAEVKGCIYYVFDIPIITIPIQTWKSKHNYTSLKNKDTKAYLDYYSNMYNKSYSYTDELDAFLIYKAFEKIIRLPCTKTDTEIKEQYEVILKLQEL